MSTHSRARTLRGVALALVLLATGACSPAARELASPSPPVSAGTAQPTAGSTASPKLVDGLEPRPGRPSLVDGEAPACIPTCGVGRAAGGMLPVGRYQTEWFFGGYMTLETDGTWERTEDSNGELSLPIAAPEGAEVYRVAFFLDPALVVDDVVQDVPRSATDYVDFLSDHEHLDVSDPIEAAIGPVPAVAVDIRLGPAAPSQYPDCAPDPCVTFLKVAAFDHSDGILGDDEYRLYFADITYSGTEHMLVVKVEGRDADDLDRVLTGVEALLETVTIPARPAKAKSPEVMS